MPEIRMKWGLSVASALGSVIATSQIRAVRAPRCRSVSRHNTSPRKKAAARGGEKSGRAARLYFHIASPRSANMASAPRTLSRSAAPGSG